jgi:7-cyano-7-deazaguanine synthase
MIILAKAGIKSFINVNLGFIRDLFDPSINGILPYELKSPAYIPAKNLIFYSIAIYYGEIYEANYIIGGHNADDNNYFPDVYSNFFNLLNRAINHSVAIQLQTL